MNISQKLLIIVLLTIIEISITIFATFQLAKGAYFHQLNVLHLKFNATFSEMVVEIRNDGPINTDELNHIVGQIRQQSIDCLDNINFLDEFIMRQVGTHYALELCVKDYEDGTNTLKALEDYEQEEITAASLLLILEQASDAFNKASAEFEQPIAITVSFIFKTMIPLVIFISVFNIFFISFLSKSISTSIKDVINLLSKKDPDLNLSEQIEENVSGELRELLIVARQRIKSDLETIEINKQLEHLVEKRTLSLQQANDELAQFAYRASHDLKAPLSSSKVLAKYIDEDIGAGNLDEASANAKRVSEQMERLEKLVVDILSLTKAELKSESKELINFSEIIDDVKNRQSWLFDNIAINFIEEINHSRDFYAEKTRVSQIIENLMTNSIKYRDPSKNNLFIKVKTYDDKENFFIVVEDNGLGIPSDQKDQVFIMFKRFHPSISSGSGLGLSIIKKHVDIMGGQINFDSSKKGTIFTIKLPK